MQSVKRKQRSKDRFFPSKSNGSGGTEVEGEAAQGRWRNRSRRGIDGFRGDGFLLMPPGFLLVMSLHTGAKRERRQLERAFPDPVASPFSLSHAL